jgi:hypothetical protein
MKLRAGVEALTLSPLVTNWSRRDAAQAQEAEELKELLEKVGGRHRDRTGGLRIANAALSQLS